MTPTTELEKLENQQGEHTRLSAGYGFRKETIARMSAMGEMRRFRTFPPSLRNGEVRPKAVVSRGRDIGGP